jgi:broad specificity phosphatase PhoE
MKKIKDKLLFIVRHGERMDMIENIDYNTLKFGRYDTELTDEGHNQAYKVGNKISIYLGENNYKSTNTVIISSPFARTLQTAGQVSRALDTKLPIFIENGLSEHLNPKWYHIQPEEFLVCMIDKETNEKKCYLEAMKEHEVILRSQTQLPTLPETHEECYLRLKEAYNKIIPYYFGVLDYDVMIMVTHFLPLEYFMKMFYDKEIKLPVEYCLTYGFTYSENTLNFVEKLHPI